MNKSTILKEYNIIKQLTAKELAVYVKTYKDNNDTIVILMARKPNKPDVLSQILERLTNIETRLTKIETRLDKHDELFKAHG